MEHTGGWQKELDDYWRSVEPLTESALEKIKNDRIQRNLPFDDGFKGYFLEFTELRSVKLTYTYM